MTTSRPKLFAMTLWWLALCLGVLRGDRLAALPALGPASVFDTWQLADGLPQISVFGLTQDVKGYLWIGTEEGLARFDGTRFEIFNHWNTPGLESHFVEELLPAPDGGLWVASSYGLGRLENQRVTLWTEAEGLASNDVRTLHRDRRGSLWVGTAGGLSRFDGTRFETFTTRDGLAKGLVYALAEDADGNLWIGTGAGLSRACLSVQDDCYL